MPPTAMVSMSVLGLLSVVSASIVGDHRCSSISPLSSAIGIHGPDLGSHSSITGPRSDSIYHDSPARNDFIKRQEAYLWILVHNTTIVPNRCTSEPSLPCPSVPADSPTAPETNLSRHIWADLSSKAILEWALVRNETSPPANDDVVNAAYDHVGQVYRLYHEVYGRPILLNMTKDVHVFVHYKQDRGSAHWQDRTKKYLVDGAFLGDSDPRDNTPQALTHLDVLGHELTHGVLNVENPMEYRKQSGELQEHLADVFGSLASQYSQGQAANESSWLIDEGSMKPANYSSGPQSLRSLKDPGHAYWLSDSDQDWQTSHMRRYNLSTFRGDVHVNHGIPNKAFYNFSMVVGGNAWEVPGRIWYNVMTRGQGNFSYSDETFCSFANRTIAAAKKFYPGDGYDEKLSVAWNGAGVFDKTSCESRNMGVDVPGQARA